MFKNNDSPLCPLLNKACIQERCMFWTHVRGANPQTGDPVDAHDCAVKWLPVLLIENAKQTREGAAAIESGRNEITDRQDILNSTMGGILKLAAASNGRQIT